MVANYEEIKKKIKRCKSMSLEDVNPDDVDELSSIKINRKKPSNERILEFLSIVKNPYIFKVNGKLVQIAFSDTNKTADESLTNVLKSLYK